MTSKQKQKIEDAKKRIDDRARKLLDTERYERCCALGNAKYGSFDDFVKAAVEHARWVKTRTTKKAS